MTDQFSSTFWMEEKSGSQLAQCQLSGLKMFFQKLTTTARQFLLLPFFFSVCSLIHWFIHSDNQDKEDRAILWQIIRWQFSSALSCLFVVVTIFRRWWWWWPLRSQFFSSCCRQAIVAVYCENIGREEENSANSCSRFIHSLDYPGPNCATILGPAFDIVWGQAGPGPDPGGHRLIVFPFPTYRWTVGRPIGGNKYELERRTWGLLLYSVVQQNTHRQKVAISGRGREGECGQSENEHEMRFR